MCAWVMSSLADLIEAEIRTGYFLIVRRLLTLVLDCFLGEVCTGPGQVMWLPVYVLKGNTY